MYYHILCDIVLRCQSEKLLILCEPAMRNHQQTYLLSVQSVLQEIRHNHFSGALWIRFLYHIVHSGVDHA